MDGQTAGLRRQQAGSSVFHFPRTPTYRRFANCKSSLVHDALLSGERLARPLPAYSGNLLLPNALIRGSRAPSSRTQLSEPEPALTASAVWIFIDLVLRLADRLQDPEHPNPRFGCTETPIFLGIYCLSPPRTPPPTLANKRPSICPKFWTPQSAVCVVGRRLRSGPIRRRVEAAEGLGGASGMRSGRIRVGGGKATGWGLGIRPIGGRMGHPEAPPRPSCGPAVPPSVEKRGDGLEARGHPPSTAPAHATRIRSGDASSRKVATNFLARSPPLLPARPAPPAEPGIPRGGAQAEMGNVGACRGPWRRRRAEA